MAIASVSSAKIFLWIKGQAKVSLFAHTCLQYVCAARAPAMNCAIEVRKLPRLGEARLW
jgi:hypothetical protein